MKKRNLVRSLMLGTIAFGVIISQQGCVILNWLKNNTCSEGACAETSCSRKTSPETGKNIQSVEVDIKPDTSSPVMVKFSKGEDVRLCITMHNTPTLTEKGFEDKIVAMAGAMLPKGFDIKSLPKAQLDLMLKDVVKIESLKRVELPALLNDSSFRTKLAQRVETDLNGMILEYIVEQLKSNTKVSDADIENEYEINLNRYIKELGGIRTIGAKYTDLAFAKRAMDELALTGELTSEEFTKVAKISRGQVRDFGPISEEFTRGAHTKILELVQSFDQYPNIGMISISDKEHWVVMAIDSKVTSYFSLNESRARILNMLEQKALEGLVSERLENAKSQAQAEISPEYATDAKQPSMEDLMRMAEEQGLGSEEADETEL